MTDKSIKPGTLVEGTPDSPNAEMQQLPARMDGMQMETDMLEGTINVQKKTPAPTWKPSDTGRKQWLLIP